MFWGMMEGPNSILNSIPDCRFLSKESFSDSKPSYLFTTDVRRALPLVQPKNVTSRAITRMTNTYFVSGPFVQQEGVTAGLWDVHSGFARIRGTPA